MFICFYIFDFQSNKGYNYENICDNPEMKENE